MIRREIIQFMRSRNIEFTGRALKPYTRIYSFFDNVDVTDFCSPKLLEISMTSGTFQVGETVIGAMGSAALNAQNFNASTLPKINFAVAQPNHKYGPFDDPTDIFVANPYDRESILPATYSESATILNMDTSGLADESEAGQGGYVAKDMILIGQTSGAQATVTKGGDATISTATITITVAGEGYKVGDVVTIAALGGGGAILGTVGKMIMGEAAAQRASGRATFSNTYVTYTGPAFRDFTYNFSLKPLAREDSDTIRRIVKFFKVNSAPKQLAGNIMRIYELPKLFGISYHGRNGPMKHMNNIAKCALTNINVVYGGDRFSVFDDSAPVQVDLKIQFK